MIKSRQLLAKLPTSEHTSPECNIWVVAAESYREQDPCVARSHMGICAGARINMHPFSIENSPAYGGCMLGMCFFCCVRLSFFCAVQFSQHCSSASVCAGWQTISSEICSVRNGRSLAWRTGRVRRLAHMSLATKRPILHIGLDKNEIIHISHRASAYATTTTRQKKDTTTHLNFASCLHEHRSCLVIPCPICLLKILHALRQCVLVPVIKFRVCVVFGARAHAYILKMCVVFIPSLGGIAIPWQFP